MVSFWLFFCIAGMGTWAYLYYRAGAAVGDRAGWHFPICDSGGLYRLHARSIAGDAALLRMDGRRCRPITPASKTRFAACASSAVGDDTAESC